MAEDNVFYVSGEPRKIQLGLQALDRFEQAYARWEAARTKLDEAAIMLHRTRHEYEGAVMVVGLLARPGVPPQEFAPTQADVERLWDDYMAAQTAYSLVCSDEMTLRLRTQKEALILEAEEMKRANQRFAQ
jgi:hypothetical protein